MASENFSALYKHKPRLKENDMQQIAEWIEKIILDVENETVILKVKAEVNEYMKQFPLYN